MPNHTCFGPMRVLCAFEAKKNRLVIEMWQQLLNSGIVKDVGIFVGAYATIHAVNRFRTRDVDPLFEEYPYIVNFGFVDVLTSMCALNQPIAATAILRAIELFLKTSVNGNVRSDGFAINRQANSIIRQVHALIDKAKRSPTDAIALAAIDFEGDQAPVLEGMIDTTVRNMLLGSR